MARCLLGPAILPITDHCDEKMAVAKPLPSPVPNYKLAVY